MNVFILFSLIQLELNPEKKIVRRDQFSLNVKTEINLILEHVLTLIF